MSNYTNIALSDENLLRLMIRQFHQWTHVKRDNVCIIKSHELFEPTILDKLEPFLRKKLHHFPIPYKRPNTNLGNIRGDLMNLFEKYKVDIDRINHFSP